MKITLLAIGFILLIGLVVIAWMNAPQNAKSDRRRWASNWRRNLWFTLYLLPLAIDRLFLRLGFARVPRGGVQFANIGEGTFENGIKSYIPDAGTASRYLLYKIGSDADHCAVTGAGDTPLGSSDDLADANNLDVPIAIKLFGAMKGMTRVVTDGTVANGARVKAGAAGKVTAAATTDLSFGMAIFGSDTSSANGDVITIIPCVPQKYVF